MGNSKVRQQGQANEALTENAIVVIMLFFMLMIFIMPMRLLVPVLMSGMSMVTMMDGMLAMRVMACVMNMPRAMLMTRRFRVMFRPFGSGNGMPGGDDITLVKNRDGKMSQKTQTGRRDARERDESFRDRRHNEGLTHLCDNHVRRGEAPLNSIYTVQSALRTIRVQFL